MNTPMVKGKTKRDRIEYLISVTEMSARDVAEAVDCSLSWAHRVILDQFRHAIYVNDSVGPVKYKIIGADFWAHVGPDTPVYIKEEYHPDKECPPLLF